MATRLAITTGNLTTAGTWVSNNTGTNAILTSTSTSTTALTTSNLDSATFTPTANACQYLAVRLGSRASGSPTNKMTIKLRNSTTATDIWTFIMNVSDIPACNTTDDNGGWVIFKNGSTHTPNGTDTYVVRAVLDSTSTAVSLSTNGTANNWLRGLFLSATGAPAAADDMWIGGLWDTTNPAVKTDVTVTQDSTATTDYGSANTNARIPAMHINKGGTLTWGTAASTNYILRLSGWQVVYAGGTLNQGTSGTPSPRTGSAELQMDCAADLDFQVWVKNGATRNFYGESRLSGSSNVFTKLGVDAAAAAISLTTTTQLSAKNGDDVGIGATNNTNRTQSETKTLNADAGATDLSLSAGLTNAHNGDNNEQALIISLTRSARVVGVNSSFMTAETWQAGATANASWASWRYAGQGTTVGGLTVNNTGSTVANCAFRESDGQAFIVNSGASITFTNCVGYNNAGSAAATASYQILTGATGVTVNGLYAMINTGTAADGFRVYDPTMFTQCDNVWMVGYTNGIQVCDLTNSGSAVSGTGQTFSNWTVNGNTTGLLLGNVSADAANGPMTIASLRAWQNNGNGISMGVVRDLLLSDCWSWDNSSNNIVAATAAGCNICNVRVTDGRFAGGGTAGVTLSGSVSIQGLIFEGCKWGSTGGGSFTANSGNTDFNFPSATNNQNYYDIFFNNCTFDQSTASSWHSASRTNKGSIFRFMKRNGNANEHVVDRFGFGTITYETTTVDASPSIKMTPSTGTTRFKLSTDAGIKGWGWFVPVDNGSAPTLSVKVQKDGSYTGNAPRLMLRRNDAIGITSDTVIATFSGSSGSFQTISGTPSAPTAAGVMEFYVDCDGSAGNIYVDTFAVTGNGTSPLNNLAYWYGGLAA